MDCLTFTRPVGLSVKKKKTLAFKKCPRHGHQKRIQNREVVKKHVLLKSIQKMTQKIVSINIENYNLNYTKVSPHTAQNGHW